MRKSSIFAQQAAFSTKFALRVESEASFVDCSVMKISLSILIRAHDAIAHAGLGICLDYYPWKRDVELGFEFEINAKVCKRGESRRSYKIIIPNLHDHFWRFGIRLESMDYCGSESLAAIEREWLAVFTGIRMSPPFFSSRLTVQNWQITGQLCSKHRQAKQIKTG
jgi:hypothetical protein